MIIREYIDRGSVCEYFKDRLCDTKYWYIDNCSALEYDKMLSHGWRRFGKLHFTPICTHCDECKSIRIVVKEFKFSKSQKRVLNKNRDTKVIIQRPTLSQEHIDLYNKYHKFMNKKKGWKFREIKEEEYYKSYVEGYDSFEYEFLYYKDDKLIGVALVDILSSAISAIYCFYDHDYSYFSIGKFSILTQIRVAKFLNIPYIYLGYWMKDHYSMGYKEEYQPFDVLRNSRASLKEEVFWDRYK